MLQDYLEGNPLSRKPVRPQVLTVFSGYIFILFRRKQDGY